MRLITRARYALARWALKGIQWQYSPTWLSRTLLSGAFASLVAEGYRKNAVFFACVEAHAFTFPEPPLWAWESEEETAAALPNHPLRRLLRRPNSDMDETQFAAACIVWAAISGNCYIHKERNAGGRVVGLRPYHEGLLRPVPVNETAQDADRIDDLSGSWVSHYLFREASGGERRIDPADVIPFSWPSIDPNAPWRAQAPILAAAREVDADNEATRYLNAILQNDAIPRTVITQSAQMALTPDETARMRAEFSTLHGGDRRGGVAILEAGADIRRLGLSMEELNFAALHDIPEQRICAVLRVPASVAGLGEDPTYANSEEAWKRFTADTRVPLWGRFASALQAGLGPEFGNSAVLRHQLGRVAALKEDASQQAGRIFTGFGAGLLGFYEARAMLGVPASPQPGDLFVAPMARELLPLPQIIALGAIPAEPPKTLPAEPKALAAPDRKAAATRTARALQRIRRSVAARMAPRLATLFDDLAAQVVANAEKVAIGPAGNKQLPGLDDLLPGGDWGLLALFRLYTITIAQESWETFNAALDVELVFDQADPAVVAALAQAGERISGIQAVTRDALRALLQYGAGQGWGVDDLIAGDDTFPGGIAGLIAQTYANRDRAIARTELGHAQQTAATARYEAAGVDRVVVLDNGTDDSDPRCTELNGTVQTLAWARANPLQHPNCVRAFAPFFLDE